MSGAERFDVQAYQRRAKELRAHFFRPEKTVPAPAPLPSFPVPPSIDLWYWDDLEKMPPPKRCLAIKNRYADRFSVTVADIEGPSRQLVVVLARHMAIAHTYVVNPHWSLPKIATFFGHRDHSSIYHAASRMMVTNTRCKKVLFCKWPRRFSFRTHKRYDTPELARAAEKAAKRRRWNEIKSDPVRLAEYNRRSNEQRRRQRAAIKSDPVRYAALCERERARSKAQRALRKARKESNAINP